MKAHETTSYDVCPEELILNPARVVLKHLQLSGSSINSPHIVCPSDLECSPSGQNNDSSENTYDTRFTQVIVVGSAKALNGHLEGVVRQIALESPHLSTKKNVLLPDTRKALAGLHKRRTFSTANQKN